MVLLLCFFCGNWYLGKRKPFFIHLIENICKKNFWQDCVSIFLRKVIKCQYFWDMRGPPMTFFQVVINTQPLLICRNIYGALKMVIKLGFSFSYSAWSLWLMSQSSTFVTNFMFWVFCYMLAQQQCTCISKRESRRCESKSLCIILEG
jgi:hypothetical protein